MSRLIPARRVVRRCAAEYLAQVAVSAMRDSLPQAAHLGRMTSGMLVLVAHARRADVLNLPSYLQQDGGYSFPFKHGAAKGGAPRKELRQHRSTGGPRHYCAGICLASWSGGGARLLVSPRALALALLVYDDKGALAVAAALLDQLGIVHIGKVHVCGGWDANASMP